MLQGGSTVMRLCRYEIWTSNIDFYRNILLGYNLISETGFHSMFYYFGCERNFWDRQVDRHTNIELTDTWILHTPAWGEIITSCIYIYSASQAGWFGSVWLYLFNSWVFSRHRGKFKKGELMNFFTKLHFLAIYVGSVIQKSTWNHYSVFLVWRIFWRELVAIMFSVFQLFIKWLGIKLHTLCTRI